MTFDRPHMTIRVTRIVIWGSALVTAAAVLLFVPHSTSTLFAMAVEIGLVSGFEIGLTIGRQWS